MHISKKSNLVESDALSLVFGYEGEVEATNNVTPLDLLIQKEEHEESDSHYATAAALSAVRRLLITIFDNGKRHPVDALAQLYLIAYAIDAGLVGNKSLKELGKIFDTSKQTFSKRLLQLNKQIKVRSRNQKSSQAVKTYSKNTKAWHAARKARANNKKGK